MCRIKPESTNLVKVIFSEACTVENMEAKFGKTLSKEEKNIKNFILSQSLVLGRIPFIDEIMMEYKLFPSKKILSILNKFDQLDIIHMDNDKITIKAAYPFSSSETFHVVRLKRKGYKKFYAMCAIDALGVSFMFNSDVSINSRCEHCSENIIIEIEENEIIFMNPKDVVVWCDREYSCCAATSICRNINFFSSKNHFAKWQKEKPKRKGNLLEIEEAFYLGKLFFENRI
jgi:hypothetical protein